MTKQTVKDTSVEELLDIIEKLDSSEEQEDWLKLQKDWLGWLDEYDGTGAYDRKPGMNYNARFMYMHHASPVGLLWLIQVLGVNPKLIKLAENNYQRVERVSEDVHTQSKAIRDRVPWEVVDRALVERLLALDKVDKAHQRKLLRLALDL